MPNYVKRFSDVNFMPFLYYNSCFLDLCELEENRQRARSLDSLQIALRTQPNSFVARFMEADGLLKVLFIRQNIKCLALFDQIWLFQVLDFLAAMDYDTRQSSIHTALLGCTKALMNNSVSIRLESLTQKYGQVGCRVFYSGVQN